MRTDVMAEKILITGITGFVGRNLANHIASLDKGHYQVIGGTRNVDSAKRRCGQNCDVEFIYASNLSPIDYAGDVDWIISAAAVTDKGTIARKPAETWIENVSGIYHSLEFARAKKVRGMLFISSASVYGVRPLHVNGERYVGMPALIHNPYSNSKLSGESLCIQYFKEYGIPVKIARLFQVYGEDWPYKRGTFLSDCISAYINDEDIVIESDGSAVRNYIHVDDAAAALWSILKNGHPGEVYDVGSTKNNYALSDVANMIYNEAKRKNMRMSVVVKGQDSGFQDMQIPDTEKILSLGWKEKREDMDIEMRYILNNTNKHMLHISRGGGNLTQI